MADLWLGNLASGTTDDEIKAFLTKYGFPAFDEIEHIPGDGTRPAVRLIFHNLSAEALHRLQPRIHGMYWKSTQLNAQVMTQHSG